MAQTGRPSSFNQALANKICERLAGGESLRKICRDDGMPSTSAVMRWLFGDKQGGPVEGFREQYEQARAAQAEHLADEIIEIADDSSGDTKEIETKDGIKVVQDAEFAARSRLRVDARKWVASKLLPKRYGEKTAVEVTGKDGEALFLPAPQVIVQKPDG